MNEKPKILIVDDQDDNRFVIKLALKEEGYEFIEAEDGKQAIEMANSLKPDVILMDAVMPNVDGFEATAAIRQNSELERTPILMITSLNEKEDRIKALEAGVNDFVSKPFDKHELKARCRSYVNMCQLNKKYIDATQNPISGLPNRGALQSDIKKMNDPVVIVLALDGYERLTGFYTLDVLQKMESEFVDLLVKSFPLEPSSYTVYHPTAGIFVIGMDLVLNIELSKDKLGVMLQTLYNEIRQQHIKFDDYEFTPLVTMGVSVGGTLPYENARTALKEAYRQRSAFLFADDVLEKAHKNIANNIEWIKKIKLAVVEDRFVPFFQPIYNNKTKSIEKYECLVRMVDTDGEVISPFHFLEISKKAKYYHQLTKLMIDKSMEVFENRTDEFSINLAGGDIENDEVRMHIMKKLREKPDVAKRMVFELLEDESFEAFDVLKSFVSEVKEYGVKIAVDDFGSGYSNFTRLMDFQPDILKLDGSLIKNIDKDQFNMNIVTTMQSFAQKIGVKTVAEFVSSEDVYTIIDELGIDYSQGYYIAAPMSLSELNRS